MFIELHMIQNFVPSNLNRDDTGSPKDCVFGGHRRARVSSQCLKRSIRTHPIFAQTTRVPVSKRTHYFAGAIKKALMNTHGKSEEEAQEFATALADAYVKPETKDVEKGSVMIFVSEEEVYKISDELAARWDEIAKDKGAQSKIIKAIAKDAAKRHESGSNAPDIALFGRMLANKPPRPSYRLEAACQVAHAISTHRVSMEMDYFTAVDDVREENEETGAGHINTLGFNSSCFYRYARIDWRQLLQNLNHDTELARRAVEGFLRASIVAVPSGKQNSTAALNPPSLLLAVVREDGMGWNLANAFEKPVAPRHESSLVEESVRVLDDYWGKLETVYGNGTLKRVATLNLNGTALTHLNGERTVANMDAWIGTVLEALPAHAEGSDA